MFMNKRLFLLALPICFASFIACNKSPDAKKDPAAPAAATDPTVSEQAQNVPDNLNKIWYYVNPDVKDFNYSVLQFKSGTDADQHPTITLVQSTYGAYSVKKGEKLAAYPSMKLNFNFEQTYAKYNVETCTADKLAYKIASEVVAPSTGNKGLAAAAAATTDTADATPAAAVQKHQVLPHEDFCTTPLIQLSADGKLVLNNPKDDSVTYQFIAIDQAKLDDLHKQAQKETAFMTPSPVDLEKQLPSLALFAKSKVLYTITTKDGKQDTVIADEKIDTSSADNIQLNNITWDAADVTKAQINGVAITGTIKYTAATAPELGTNIEITYVVNANDVKSLVKAKLLRLRDKVYVLRVKNLDKDGSGTVEDTILAPKDVTDFTATKPPVAGNK